MPSAYHITMICNLGAIWESGFLLSDDGIAALGGQPATFAHENIKERRRQTVVSAGRGGNLCAYVPFYFCNRSPMLATVFYRDGREKTRGQEGIAHLRVDVQEICRSVPDCVFTDGHGIMAMSNFYKDLGDLAKLDWDAINSHSWADTIENPDQKRRKQAEFLVYERLPIVYIREIGVMTHAAKEEADAQLVQFPVRPEVTVRPEWYYR